MSVRAYLSALQRSRPSQRKFNCEEAWADALVMPGSVSFRFVASVPGNVPYTNTQLVPVEAGLPTSNTALASNISAAAGPVTSDHCGGKQGAGEHLARVLQ